ncbi:ABC transporter permease [Cohnella terricola]|uniref:ABC transporter permease n=2 Tax=Cohnella terricola TaxID=1289167 RepID=A0A559JXM2_9BACL|nr:ABC transporter permease [Cohnella terricola]
MLVPVLLGMSIIVFMIIHAIPGDPAVIILGQKATPEAIAELHASLGLNDPWYVQYFSYLKNIAGGDLGTSIQTKTAISKEIGPYLAATFELTVFSMLFAIFIGVNAGILSAWRRNSWFDYTAMLIALIGVSMPVFWLGLMEQWLFAQHLNWLPSIGRVNARDPVESISGFYVLDTILARRFDQLEDVFKHLVLPGIAMGTVPMAIIARITRAGMSEAMASEYIRTARSKGVHEFMVVYKHALKNAFIPILTVIGLQTGMLLGGAVLTETIFGWPGIGRYLYSAISARDYPVIQSGILVIAVIFVCINLVVDLLYAYFDPRIKHR